MNSGTKNDLGTDQHSVEIRKKMHICCAAAKAINCNATTRVSKWWAQGIYTYIE
jgi:hypothetical protein